MIMYNPWHGCHKYSEGCRNCYMFYFDSKRGIDSNIITKTQSFYMPLQKDKKGNYKGKSGVEIILNVE